MPYRKRDVNILYEIITSAEQSESAETLPFKAIFTAYDIVLARYGLDPNRDQVYFRFLLRLGESHDVKHSLYETFLESLAELGIQLQFDEEGDFTGRLDFSDAVPIEHISTPQQSNGSRRSRRASFSSLRKPDEDSPRVSRHRNDSRASLSRLQDVTRTMHENRPSTRATTRPTERIHSQVAHPISNTLADTRTRLTAAQFASIHQHHPRRRESVSSHGSPQISNRNASTRTVVTQPLGGVPSQVNSSSINETPPKPAAQVMKAPYVLAPSEFLYRPSLTQLLQDADTFRDTHIRCVAGDVIWTWLEAALRMRRDHQKMTDKAVSRDVDVLRRQAFEQWRLVFLTSRQTRETERFFDALGRRATRARDVYLLTKAFTHWAQCASEEVERTSVARRHILRTRYFNAWRDITAVNDLKIRRQGLRKFFPLWKGRHELVLAAESKAIVVYESKLANSIYWRWFWNFCERRAPAWGDTHLKRQYLLKWQARTYSIRQQDVEITICRSTDLQRQCLQKWLEKFRIMNFYNHQAEQVRYRRLLACHLPIWQLQFQYLPLARRISSMVDWRIAYSTFYTLLRRFTLERRAETVSQLRILRNAWTDWNDRLRWQTLARQIDERLLTQALYRWVLAERYTLLKRLHQKRVKQRFFKKVVGHWKLLSRHQETSIQVIQAGHSRRCMASVIAQWRTQAYSCNQQKQLAHEYNAPRVTQDALQIWKKQSAHIRKLASWARDAAFYFRASRTFKRWHVAIAESQKQKRREAYSSVRRRVKINLARKVIENWRNYSSLISQLNQAAENANQRRTLAYGTALFDRWRGGANHLIERTYQVDKQYAESLLHEHIQLWVNRFTAHQQMQKQGYLYARLHVSKTAYESLRALRLKVLELHSRKETAISLNQSNEKRYYRNLLRIWREKTARRRGQPSQDLVRTTGSRRFGLSTDKVGDEEVMMARSNEGWTAFDDDFELSDWIPALEAQTSETPLPGYLSTPSKRAARARALVKLPSTTPATPLGTATPFQRRLRMQAATDPRGEGRAGPGRSDFARSMGAGRKGAFEDIPEGSSTLGSR
ncbi:MAG: hypothetical protein Q9187_000009 [Circinaria calcarea]